MKTLLAFISIIVLLSVPFQGHAEFRSVQFKRALEVAEEYGESHPEEALDYALFLLSSKYQDITLPNGYYAWMGNQFNIYTDAEKDAITMKLIMGALSSSRFNTIIDVDRLAEYIDAGEDASALYSLKYMLSHPKQANGLDTEVMAEYIPAFTPTPISTDVPASTPTPAPTTKHVSTPAPTHEAGKEYVGMNKTYRRGGYISITPIAFKKMDEVVAKNANSYYGPNYTIMGKVQGQDMVVCTIKVRNLSKSTDYIANFIRRVTYTNSSGSTFSASLIAEDVTRSYLKTNTMNIDPDTDYYLHLYCNLNAENVKLGKGSYMTLELSDPDGNYFSTYSLDIVY